MSTTPVTVTQEVILAAPQTHLVADKEFVGSMLGATPEVSNLRCYVGKNVAPVTVTNFLKGQEGQPIAILGDGNMTIKHGTNIYNNTGADKLLAANKIYRYTKINSKWYEDA